MKTPAMRTALIAVLTAFATLPALADDDDLPKMRAVAAGAKLISLEDAQTKALAAKPGTLVGVDLERRFMGRNYDYEFEVIDAEGKEWEVNINARDGSVRSVRQDWFE